VSDELDWGPTRPPALGWAGALLIVVSLAQMGFFATALALDTSSLVSTDADQVAVASVGGLLILQLLAGVAVLRQWRWWRAVAVLLSLIGIALQVANLAGEPDRPIVVGINAGLAVLYALVVILIFRSRRS
jgi:hypothetical protein